jgi:hypothetical protein
MWWCIRGFSIAGAAPDEEIDPEEIDLEPSL